MELEKENVVETVETEEVVATEEVAAVEVEETDLDELSRQIRESIERMEKALGEDTSYEEEVKSNKEINETLERIRKNQEQIAQDISRREKEFFEKEKAQTLKENGLEAFADIISVNDSEALSDVVAKLTAIVNDIKVGAGYVPKENAKQAEYDVYAQNKDVKKMIGSKLANFFK